MSSKLFWFSGTGSSYWVARKIGENLANSDIFPIINFNHDQSVSSDIIGIVFPVYAWGPPKAVNHFLKNLKLDSFKYLFIVMTYAEDCGSTANIIKKILKKKGISLSASFSIKMPNNYPLLYKKTLKTTNTDYVKDAKNKTYSIIDLINKKAVGTFEEASMSKKILSIFIYPLFLTSLNLLDRLFYTNNKCNLCGICEKVCPNNNINIHNKKILWKHNCEQCFACYHLCPQKAIQYSKITETQKRYIFPEVKLKDILEFNKK